MMEKKPAQGGEGHAWLGPREGGGGFRKPGKKKKTPSWRKRHGPNENKKRGKPSGQEATERPPWPKGGPQRGRGGWNGRGGP